MLALLRSVVVLLAICVPPDAPEWIGTVLEGLGCPVWLDGATCCVVSTARSR